MLVDGAEPATGRPRPAGRVRIETRPRRSATTTWDKAEFGSKLLPLTEVEQFDQFVRMCQNSELSCPVRGHPHEKWGVASQIAPFRRKVGAEGGQLWTQSGENHIGHDSMD